MSKESILNNYRDINQAYNNSMAFDSLSMQLDEFEADVRAMVIDEYMNKLCDKCIQAPNECWNLECPFADDECQVIKIAEQLKEQSDEHM